MIAFRIINRQRKIRVCLSTLEKMTSLALPYCLSALGKGDAILSSLRAIEITLVSNRAIAKLHRQFFNDPSPTDVITFPHGEIIISAETAAANCQRYHHSLTAEITIYIIHGLLHLNGYEDRSPEQAATMAEKQAGILEAVCGEM